MKSLKIATKYEPKSSHIRLFDWSAITDDYDGGDPIGYGVTEEAAIDDLLDQLREYAA